MMRGGDLTVMSQEGRFEEMGDTQPGDDTKFSRGKDHCIFMPSV